MGLRKRRTDPNIVAGVIVLLVLVGMVVLGVASWRECIRVHPWWYCAAGR